MHLSVRGWLGSVPLAATESCRSRLQVDDEEEQPKLEEYGVGATGFHRGALGRSSRGRTRRGLKKRSTVKAR